MNYTRSVRLTHLPTAYGRRRRGPGTWAARAFGASSCSSTAAGSVVGRSHAKLLGGDVGCAAAEGPAMSVSMARRAPGPCRIAAAAPAHVGGHRVVDARRAGHGGVVLAEPAAARLVGRQQRDAVGRQVAVHRADERARVLLVRLASHHDLDGTGHAHKARDAHKGHGLRRLRQQLPECPDRALHCIVYTQRTKSPGQQRKVRPGAGRGMLRLRLAA